MTVSSKLGYWTGDGTAGNPYRPEIATRYACDWHVKDLGRKEDGVSLFDFIATAGIEASIAADTGLIPSEDNLPTPSPDTLTMPLNPLDLATALAGLSAGDTLTLEQGIYELQDTFDNPLGALSTVGNRTIIQAAEGARVVITAPNGGVPRVRIRYAHIRNIWFAGEYFLNDWAVVMENSAIVEKCTFAGYRQCIIEGTGVNNLYLNNRFFNCGYPGLQHAIYIAGDDIGLSKNATIRGNIFVGCDSYCISLFHKPDDCLVENNFMANSRWHIVHDGDNNTIRKNILWSSIQTCLNPSGTNCVFANNLFGYAAGMSFSIWDASTDVSGNHYLNKTAKSQDSNPQAWSFADVRPNLGRTYLHIQQVCDALESKFSEIGTATYEDGTIDYYVDVLESVVVASESL